MSGLTTNFSFYLPVESDGIDNNQVWAAAINGNFTSIDALLKVHADAIATKMANPMTSLGDLIVGGTAGTPGRKAAGADGQVFTMVAGVPTWAGSGVLPRMTTTVTLPVIQPGASDRLAFELARTTHLLSVGTDSPAEVRIYDSQAACLADISRSTTTPPLAGMGLVCQNTTTSGKLIIQQDPVTTCANLDSTPSNMAWVSVRNTDPSVAKAITVTIVHQPHEVAPPTTGTPDISSTFDIGMDGWSVANDGTTSWNPGGWGTMDDWNVGLTTYFNAPAKFLGNKSAYFGGTITFDIRVRTAPAYNADPGILTLIGTNGVQISVNGTIPTLNAWTTYLFNLSTSADWRFGSAFAGDRVATNTEIQSVLADIAVMKICTEYTTAIDHTDIDNVIMHAL
ncbi:laminin B domain-containing protein [Geothrix fuzhouensis]|uniref:laminin B domain-containing protein n=1 Tax=Geothrix fuzhouensis TaxID=2966451 RepID=UPI002147326F|nr:laminin B domain-containing protein [Geothrix fuzhouensis]